MATIQKRTNSKGETSYRVQVRLKGYAPEQATFARLTDARNWAQETESAMRQRRFFKTAESKKHTVADMIDRYISKVADDSPKRCANLKPMLLWWREQLGHTVLADLSAAQITECIEALSKRTHRTTKGVVKKISPARVNRYTAAFSHVCSVAMNEWEWLEQHPMRRIKKKKEPRGRVRFLSDEERECLLEACLKNENRNLYQRA